MSSAKIEKLARMANQIGEYHGPMPPEQGAEGVATHIRKFWTPKMIREALAAWDQGTISLNETTARGFAILRNDFVVTT